METQFWQSVGGCWNRFVTSRSRKLVNYSYVLAVENANYTSNRAANTEKRGLAALGIIESLLRGPFNAIVLWCTWGFSGCLELGTHGCRETPAPRTAVRRSLLFFQAGRLPPLQGGSGQDWVYFLWRFRIFHRHFYAFWDIEMHQLNALVKCPV